MINFKSNTGTGMGGGFALGTQSTAATTTTPTGFMFGSTATPSLIGQTPTTAAPPMAGFSFGTQTTAAPPTTSGFSLGATTVTGTSTATGFGLGGTSTATGFGLGGVSLTPASSATTGTGTGFSFGGMGATPASTSGFSMGGGLVGTTPALASTGFSFGTTTTQASATKPSGFGFGMTNTTPQTSVAPVSSSGGLGGTGIGLGGAQPPSANAGANSTGAKSDGKSAKEQQLPQDLFGTIAVFESWRNAENSSSEENIRQTAAPFHKVGKKAEEIQQHLSELASEYLQLHASAMNLKAEVMKEAEHVEMARRTKDTPMALQGENKSPEMYFINLVRSFESEMIYCRNKIDEVSLCMQAANNPCETPEDIAEVLQREHETLKEMAAKVYAKHSQLVELSHHLSTKATPNEQAFFRPQSKKDAYTPASSVVRPVLAGCGSGLQAFQEQQQRAKAVTLGAAPPTMPLSQTTAPSLFGSNTGSSIFTGGSPFGTNTFNLGSTANNSSFGSKSLFANTSGFGSNLNFAANTTGIQQSSSPFAMSSPFSTKPFGS